MITTIRNVFDRRFFLMGIAMLWIMLYHAGLAINIPFISQIKSIGYGGVDIFLLCSGYGCYCSLEKNGDAASFFHRRIIRLMPTWLIFMLIWIPTMITFREMPLEAVIGNIFGIQSLTSLGNDFNWYISALWIFYILSPYLHHAIKSHSFRHNILLILFTVILSIPFWNNSDLIICVSRLPIYCIGMVLAKYRESPLTRQFILGALCCSIVGTGTLFFFLHYVPSLLWNYALYWYPFILITFGICICLTFACALLEKYCPPPSKIITAIGRISFDAYLIHIFGFDILNFFIAKQIVPDNNVIWISAIVISLAIAYLFNAIVQRITDKLYLQKA